MPWREALVSLCDRYRPAASPAPGRDCLCTENKERTLGAITWLGMTGIFIIIILAIYAARANDSRILLWGTITACCGALSGGVLGLLFGLPTTHRPATTGGSGESGQGSDGGSGYDESTSLEQVADWLTKIIVGLTLTQYPAWIAHFEILAGNITNMMLGQSANPAPGGVLIVTYTIIGFVVSYLWMRRYFIPEMVIARTEIGLMLESRKKKAEAEQKADRVIAQNRVESTKAKDEQLALVEVAAAEQQRIVEAAQTAGLAEEASARATVQNPELAPILDRGRDMLTPASAAAKQLEKIIKLTNDGQGDPMDPWKGKFGETASAATATLTATVSEMENPQLFKVALEVKAGADVLDRLVGTKVLYFLHPTFRLEPHSSVFGPDGRAPLELFAYGAFTVGVLLEQDGTMLELNLATLPEAPDRFRSR